jgi:kynurenine formamidase
MRAGPVNTRSMREISNSGWVSNQKLTAKHKQSTHMHARLHMQANPSVERLNITHTIA